MKFARQDLLDTIDAVKKKYEADVAEYSRVYELYKAEEVRKWNADARPRWKALRNLISDSNRAGWMITEQAVKKAMQTDYTRSSSMPYFTVTSHGSYFTYEGTEYRHPYSPSHRMEGLRLALLAMEDEIVSTSSLSVIGFKDFEWLFSAAVQLRAAQKAKG